MAVVRCPTHNVPYNDENPRGCPACWQEKIGDDPAQLMRELARASKAIPHVEILPPPTEDELPPMHRLATGAWPGPVTQPPRVPTPEPTQLQRLWHFLRANLAAVVGTGLIAVAAVLVWVITRPTFESALLPPVPTSDARPFPVAPNTPIIGAFALFGPRAPEVNPDSPTLARYDFGEGTLVDALNGVVYAVTLESPDRSWEGNRVGMEETRARGTLALLGPLADEEPAASAPFPLGGYLAYRRLADLPRRHLTAAVRPPNGCYDVRVEVAPRVIGTATRADETFVAVARRGGTTTWVVHRVRVVSRALRGPYAGPPACE
ncbi:MAG TPA: hypothetical protein VGA02_01870 [Gemmatimonadales bacterium]